MPWASVPLGQPWPTSRGSATARGSVCELGDPVGGLYAVLIISYFVWAVNSGKG